MSKDSVAIKGILGGLAIIVNNQIDSSKICEELTSKLEASKGFFRGAYFTIAPSELPSKLVTQLVDLAEAYGLIYSASLIYPTRTTQSQGTPVEAMAAATVAVENEPITPLASQTFGVNAFGLTEQEAHGETLLINQSLRSGQHINYDGNVVILGDVNPGAEVIATGSIVVMGTLRGIVHAGAAGDPKSKIVAYRLLANQIRIGNQIGRSPDDKEEHRIVLVPEVARLGKEGIVLEQYLSTKRVTAM